MTIIPPGRPVQIGPYRPERPERSPHGGLRRPSEGEPDVLTIRRYQRFAAGGAGLLWFEATAVVPEGRANPRQLWFHPASGGVRRSRGAGPGGSVREASAPTMPCHVVQLTHSGRYSSRWTARARFIAHHDPVLDPRRNACPRIIPIITDDELERLKDAYVEAARLARQAGSTGWTSSATHATSSPSCWRPTPARSLWRHLREPHPLAAGCGARVRPRCRNRWWPCGIDVLRWASTTPRAGE